MLVNNLTKKPALTFGSLLNGQHFKLTGDDTSVVFRTKFERRVDTLYNDGSVSSDNTCSSSDPVFLVSIEINVKT